MAVAEKSKAMNAQHIGQPCQSCSLGRYVETVDSNEWWVKCDNCDQLVFVYTPMPHQLRFHNDPVKYKMYAGGKKSHSRLKTIQIRGNSKGLA